MILDSKRKLAAIMFTDLVGYSAITNRNESLALQLLQEHRDVLRPLFAEFGGREVKTIGDGFLVEFASALEAVQCAMKIQDALLVRNRQEPNERRILVRIGVHVGDVVVSSDDVYGDGVNIAARLQQFAQPGTICLTQQVYEQIRNKVHIPSKTVIHAGLKNIRGQQKIYQIAPHEPPAAPVLSRWATAFSRRTRRLSRSRRAATALGAVLGAILLAVITQVGPKEAPVAPPAVPQVPGAESRIAVLPFRSIGLGKNDEYVSDAMTEDLILALSKVPGARVIARSSIEAYRGTTKSAGKIAAELNVGTIIEGSLRKSGERIKATVSLVDPKTETTFWATESEERSYNLFDLQGKLAQSVSSKLRMRRIASVEPRAMVAHAPEPKAFALYLKGRYFMNLRTEESLRKGVSFFKESIEADPAFPGPYVGLANCFGLMGYYQYLSPREAFVRGLFYSDKALELDPQSADALTSMASRKMYYDHDWPGAEAFYGRAIELSPGYSSAHSWYADFLIASNRLPEARKEIALALDLDPLSLIINTTAGHPEYYALRYNEAIQRYTSALEMDPTFLPARLWLGRALTRKGEYSRATEVLRAAATAAPKSATVLAALAQALAFSGNLEEARALRFRLEASATERYLPSYDLAGIDLALGERERALAHLEAAFEERSYHIVFAPVDPLFQPLSGEPRFKALARKVRTPEKL